MEKLSELRENSERQFNELRNKINEESKYFTKDIEAKKEPNRNSETEVNKWYEECVRKHWK